MEMHWPVQFQFRIDADDVSLDLEYARNAKQLG